MTPSVAADLMAIIESRAHNVSQLIKSRKRIEGVLVLPIEAVEEEGHFDVLALQIIEQTLGQDRRTIVKCQGEGSGLSAPVDNGRDRLPAAAPIRLAASAAVVVGESRISILAAA